MTHHERRSRQVLLELLVETCEEYEREVEGDRELYQVIALDAKGIAHRRITAGAAAKLLAEAGQKTMQARADAEPCGVATRKATRAKTDAVIAATAH